MLRNRPTTQCTRRSAATLYPAAQQRRSLLSISGGKLAESLVFPDRNALRFLRARFLMPADSRDDTTSIVSSDVAPTRRGAYWRNGALARRARCSKAAHQQRERKNLSGSAQSRRVYDAHATIPWPPPFPAAASGVQLQLRTHLKRSDQALSRRESRAMKSVACGSPPPRAYRPYRSCGRVAEGGGLLNRYRVVKPYRGFESLRLRQPPSLRFGAPSPPDRVGLSQTPESGAARLSLPIMLQITHHCRGQSSSHGAVDAETAVR